MLRNHDAKFNMLGSKAVNNLALKPRARKFRFSGRVYLNSKMGESESRRLGGRWGMGVEGIPGAKLGFSFFILGSLCSWLCTGYATRASQWVNSSAACRIIQNICEQGCGPGQAASLPQWRQAEAWVPGHQDLQDSPWSSLFSALHWRTGNHGTQLPAWRS